MRRKTVKFWTGILMAGMFCMGCSKTGIGGNPELLKEDSAQEEAVEETAQKNAEGDSEEKVSNDGERKEPYFDTFDTDRTTFMNGIKEGSIRVEDDEKYGDYPERMESCRAKSGLFHMDIFDNSEEYKEKRDGTYMVQIIYYMDRLQTEEGKKEALKLLEEVCGQLDVIYEEDKLWGYVEEVLAETGKWDKYREEDYKKNAHIRVGKEENDTEVNIRITVPEK